jgi:hypothetical protein
MSALDAARMRVPPARSIGIAAAVLWIETVVVGWYVLYQPVRITDPLVLVYPLVWINASLLALWLTDAPDATRRLRLIGALLGVGYFLVLAYVGGLIQIHALHGGHSHAFGLAVTWPLPPGWGPTVIVSGDALGVAITPYKVLGYATLAYLVYVTALETAGSVWAGVVGLFSCVSCTWPVLGTALAGALGGSAAVVVFASERPYTASTIVFLSAVALLLWRPFGRGSQTN